jgi:hypothetical protein
MRVRFNKGNKYRKYKRLTKEQKEMIYKFRKNGIKKNS